MTNIREAIRERSRLARMRQGQDVPEMVTIPSMPDVRCGLVPLTEAESQRGVVRAAQLDVLDNAAGLQARNRAAVQSDVFYALRDPSDPTKLVFESVEAMVDDLDPNDIDMIADELMTLMDYASPSIDGISDAQLDELKKASDKIDWRGLTGRQWAVVKLYLSVLSPELLQARSLGSTSTASATETSANDESI